MLLAERPSSPAAAVLRSLNLGRNLKAALVGCSGWFGGYAASATHSRHPFKDTRQLADRQPGIPSGPASKQECLESVVPGRVTDRLCSRMPLAALLLCHWSGGDLGRVAHRDELRERGASGREGFHHLQRPPTGVRQQWLQLVAASRQEPPIQRKEGTIEHLGDTKDPYGLTPGTVGIDLPPVNECQRFHTLFHMPPPLAAASAAELVIRSTGAGLFITAAGHAISVRRSVYYGADCFIPVRSVDVSRCPLSVAFRSAPIETRRKSSVI